MTQIMLIFCDHSICKSAQEMVRIIITAYGPWGSYLNSLALPALVCKTLPVS